MSMRRCAMVSSIRRMLCVVLLTGVLPVFAAGWDDNARYPAVQQFLKDLDLSVYRSPDFDSRPWWCDAPRAVEIPEDMIEEFFLAGAQDGITIIRLFSLMAITVRDQGIALCGSGDVLARVVRRNRINLGMSLPMENIAVYSWIPFDDPNDPYSIARSIIVYREPYTFIVPKDVMPADIKVGTWQKVPYTYGSETGTGALVTLGFHVSSNRVGFENIRGLGARLHGPLGYITSLLPFIPDDIHHLYLEQNTLFARALIAKEIPGFEDEERNQIRVDPALPASEPDQGTSN